MRLSVWHLALTTSILVPLPGSTRASRATKSPALSRVHGTLTAMRGGLVRCSLSYSRADLGAACVHHHLCTDKGCKMARRGDVGGAN